VSADWLPSLNAFLNLIAAVLLTFGYLRIRQLRRESHRKFMLAAVVVSGLFLISYVIYHYQAGSTPYPYHDWTRPLYFVILIAHIVLAAAIVPMVIAALIFAFRGRFDRHRRVTRRLWPMWMFVSLSGLAVYLMLYHHP
jgi:uncharacterized membrane protein YozB (DUF420 family)